MLWIIYAESANYAGYGQHFVVEASTDDMAVAVAEHVMNEYFYEQDCDELIEDGIDPDENSLFMVCSVDVLDETNEHWGWFHTPSQSEFYIRVNF